MQNILLFLSLAVAGIISANVANASDIKDERRPDVPVENKDTTAIAALDFSKAKGNEAISWREIERFVKENPSSVSWSTDKCCPECGSKAIVINYRSSEDSWKNLAGREGILTVCPKCMEQLFFMLLKMN